jgi:hypothetical protein
VLSELFTLTCTLEQRFPLDHPAIRAWEILGKDSVIYTYQAVDEKSQAMTLDEAARLVERGLDEADVVVEPQPADSDEEEEPISRRRPPRRNRLGTTVAVAVLCLGVGIAVYQMNRGRDFTQAKKTVHRWIVDNAVRFSNVLRAYIML